MGILKPFEVNHGEFIKDLYLFLGLILIAFFFVYDQKLWNWECASMIFFYFGYVTYTILFTNDGKNLDIFDEEEQQYLDPRLSPQSTCRSRERAESIMSLDLNKVKTHQKLSVFEAQKVWRALSPSNSEFSDDLSPRPSITRVRSAEVIPSSNLFRTPTKSASANNIHVLPNTLVAPTPEIPQIVIEVPEDEDSNAPIEGDDNPLSVRSFEEDRLPQYGPLMNSGSTEFLAQDPETLSISMPLTFLRSWRFLLEPLVDEPLTFITVISGFIVLFFNIIIPAYPTKLIDDPHTHYKEIHSRNQLFFFQLSISPIVFGHLLLHGIEWWQTLFASLALVFLNVILRRFTSYTLPMFGFFSSILTVITLSSILIPILKNIGVIFQISESLLGLTILAIGNSTGDLISNLTLAKLGLSVIGINACFGAPLLYVLFGIGISGLTLNIRHKVSFMDIEVENHFKVSSTGLIIMLIFYAIVIPLNHWRIDRRVGIIGVTWWCTITAVNVYLEISK
jgi:sodium/potassium/calcium exchanger 6